MALSIAMGKEITGEFCKKENIALLLIEAAEKQKGNGITYILNSKEEVFLSYQSLFTEALHVLGALQQKGLKRGDFVLLVLDENEKFIKTFWACVLGGMIPVPLAYPTITSKETTQLTKLNTVWNVLGKPYMISDEQVEKNPRFQGMGIINVDSLLHFEQTGEIYLAQKDTPALIQFSSGSTSTPKGVILTHDNLLTNIEGMVRGANLNQDDSMLSWMPYHHDMGLIGFHLTPTAIGINQYNIHPLTFVKRPTLWLDSVTKHKATITGSPNFGYRLLLNRAKVKNYLTWDLQSVRLLFNGAEPISVSVMEEFMMELEQCRLDKKAMFPVYGMAEACLGVCFPPLLDREPFVHSLDRGTLVRENKVKESKRTNENGILLVDEGNPVPGLDIRVVDECGEIVPEGVVGEIQIRGRNVTSGYINNPDVTKKSFQEEWLKTGDMGFMINGRITITGRLKDIIFVKGQNYYAHDIEGVIDTVEGVKPGKVAVCGWHDEEEGQEKVALFSTLRFPEEEMKGIYRKILSHVNEVMGIPIDYVCLIRSIPKTTSGKVQRFVLVEGFKNNEYTDRTLLGTDLFMMSEKEPRKIGEYTNSIREIWAKVLERPVETISDNQPFMSLGGTSIKAVQVLGALEEELSLPLTHDLLIHCRTIQEMNEYLLQLEQVSSSSYKEVATAREVNHGEEDEIAVIAMTCRFPDAANPDEFWKNLLEGKCSIQDIPEDRWNRDDYYHPSREFGKTYCQKGAFIDTPYDFDAGIFHIPEDEAAIMDPQQRIMLELVYELIEKAGYGKDHMSGRKVGLFVGAGANTYYEHHLNTLNRMNLQGFASFSALAKEQQEAILEEWKTKFGVTEVHPNILVDNLLNMIASRTSQEFNFKGPSMVIDTACSSSLVTLHMACESLQRGESEVAIAGGINLLLTPTSYIYFSQAEALSASGQSRVFDGNADGFVPGEGAGLVMLKPLKKAQADQDSILAVIKASAINNDGHSIGVMAPNPDGQREVIERLYVEKGISPNSIQMVEAHGTGTKIGDPSEVRAISQAFDKWQINAQSIAIGSVKANIGHLLGAAGIASFIKTVLALTHKKIPQNVNISTPNPMIKWNQSPFYFLSQPKEWDVKEGMARRAAINSFGFGGTNCHMVVEEAPDVHLISTDKLEEPSKHVLCLSAHTKSALEKKISNLQSYLERHQDVSLGDVCYTENVSRTSLSHRSSFVAGTSEELISVLRKGTKAELPYYHSPKVALMFTGQGSQYVGMAKELYQDLPYFKQVVDECSEAFYPYLQQNITDLMYGEGADERMLAQTNITQPVVFTIDYAIGKTLMNLGVKPFCMLGHSVGEWVAACLAGVVSLQDAARLVAIRGKLMHELETPGTMAAVFTSSSALESLLEPFKDSLWVAGYNVTHQVVSGEIEAMERFLKELEGKRIPFKGLKVSQAFHTPLMNPMLPLFKKELEKTTFNRPSIPIVSNVTGEYMNGVMDADYWVYHILGAVKFEQSIHYVLNKGISILVEAGPDGILAGMAKGIPAYPNKTILSTLDRKKDSWMKFCETLGNLYQSGVKISWDQWYKDRSYKKIPLPSYPFERKTFKPEFGDGQKVHKWFYEWNWQQEKEAERDEIGQGAILVFDNQRGKGKEIARKVDGERNPVYTILPGTDFHYDGQGNFVIDPQNPGHYRALLQQIPGDIAAVVHLWNAENENVEPNHLLMDDHLLVNSAYSLLFIGRALAEGSVESVRVMIVTNKAFSILAKEQVGNPYQGISIALGHGLDSDYDWVQTYILDMDFSEYDAQEERWVETLIHELNRKMNKESIVAIRGGKPYIRSLRKVSTVQNKDDLVIQDGETYLITGGSGFIGGQIARALASQAKINVVLTGRKPMPPVELMKELEESGAQVDYYSVDVIDQLKMAEVIEDVKNTRGAIHGVVHAAGVVNPSFAKLLQKDLTEIEDVLYPKVKGTLIVDELTKDQPLKFFVTLSSVSASKKSWSAGLGDYAAANAFLNSYSMYRGMSESPGRSLSMNYSLWDDCGMGSLFGDLSVLTVKAQKLQPLSAKEASQAFLQALHYDQQHVIHIYDLIKESVEQQSTLGNKLASTVNYAEKKPVKSARELRRIVYEVIASEINKSVNQLEVSMNFLELSIDSMRATKVIGEIGKKLNVELYPTLLFEYQTPEALADYLEKTYVNHETESVVVDLDSEKQNDVIQDIAIIGIGLRIPGAKNLDEYWDLLENGKCMIQEVPADRWDLEKHYSQDPHSLHTTNTKHGGFINQPYDFDPMFFGMSPKEAEVTDPQQRIFLQIAWEVLQQAGYGGKHRTNKIGVFVGTEQNSYMEHFIGYRSYMLIKESLEKQDAFLRLSQEDRQVVLREIEGILEPGELVADAIAGNGLNEVAARVSHCLNLTGPSMIVNTACSSSLVALHHACESIRQGQAEMAIAGGVNLNLTATPFVSLSRVTALSQTGVCYPFDNRANGMVLSEGAGAVLLKPLQQAINDGDYIHGVIKASAVNNDGHSQGITAPRPQGQAEVIRQAYVNGGIHPETISYVETHGTGTPLGDPIEVEGMAQAFRSFTSKKGFCGIGSVKSSIGHMLSAAGIVSLIKVVLAMKHQRIPHTIHFEEANQNINFSESPFYVVDKKPRTWERKGEIPRRAGVNAFGFGGTNAHVILEEAPAVLSEELNHKEEDGPYVLFLSGRTEEVIKKVANQLGAFVENHPELPVSSICYTMNHAQKEMTQKYAVMIQSREHLIWVLKGIENGDPLPELIKGKSNPNRQTPIHLLLDGKKDFSEQYNKGILLAKSGIQPAYLFCKNNGMSLGEAIMKASAWNCSLIEIAEDEPWEKEVGRGDVVLHCGEESLPNHIIGVNLTETVPVILAKLYTLGVRFNPGFLFAQQEKRIPLPTYPYENKTYNISHRSWAPQETKVSKVSQKKVVNEGDVDQLNRDLQFLKESFFIG